MLVSCIALVCCCIRYVSKKAMLSPSTAFPVELNTPIFHHTASKLFLYYSAMIYVTAIGDLHLHSVNRNTYGRKQRQLSTQKERVLLVKELFKEMSLSRDLPKSYTQYLVLQYFVFSPWDSIDGPNAVTTKVRSWILSCHFQQHLVDEELESYPCQHPVEKAKGIRTGRPHLRLLRPP